MQLDGSGYDRTQHTVIKRIVDQQIYAMVAPYVQHVPIDLFTKFAFAEKRKVNCNYNEGAPIRSVKKCGGFIQDGAVFSGSCDTTLMNTIRMAIYNRFVNEHLLGFSYGFQYEVVAKGDDTAAVYLESIPRAKIEAAYKKVFVMGGKPEEWLDMHHGLGQVAKYFKWSDIEGIDFCSTETIYCPRSSTYKIIRQMPRFFNLTGFSTKVNKFIQSYKEDGVMIYLESLYQSNLKWMHNIPIFRAYNYLLHRDCTGLQYKTKQGKTKMILYNKQSLLDDDEPIEMDSYKYVDRTSYKHINECDYYDYFMRKYNLGPAEIASIEQDILTTPIGKNIDCPLLEYAIGLQVAPQMN